jgi:protein-tyrosine phosphatase
MADLPPARSPGRYRIAVVCLGNICRSPMAEVVLADRLQDAGLADRVEVVSAGTAGQHLGEPMDRRAASLLAAHGYALSEHRSRQFEPSWHEDCDVVLAMDAANHRDLTAVADELAGSTDRLRMFRDFDPLASDHDRDVPDPFFGEDDGFDRVLRLVRRTCDEIVRRLPAALG